MRYEIGCQASVYFTPVVDMCVRMPSNRLNRTVRTRITDHNWHHSFHYDVLEPASAGATQELSLVAWSERLSRQSTPVSDPMSDRW